MGNEKDCTATLQSPITADFLEKILKQKIVSFKASQGTKPGDNYSTNLISLEVITTKNPEKTLHLLYKTFPNHPARQNIMKQYNVFLKEFQVYDLWIQEIKCLGNRFGLKLALPEVVSASAIDYLSTDSKDKKYEDLSPILSNYICMVDARKTEGFKMANKLHGLDYHHVRLILDELAKYHAIGHAYKVKNKLPTFRSKFPFLMDNFFSNKEQRPVLLNMLKMNWKLVNDSCQEFLKEKPEIAEAMKKFENCEMSADYMALFLDSEGMDEEKMEGFLRKKPKCYQDTPPLNDQWLVVSHGDCWTNNLLFKYDNSEKVNGALLVDLQLCREGCLMADLVYFLFTSTDAKFRKQYLEEMLGSYRKKFIYYCGFLNVDPFPGFTLDNFLRKFHRSKVMGYLFASMVLPIILQKPETAANLDDVNVENSGNGGNETDDFIASLYKNKGRDKEDEKILSDRLSEILEELYEDGVI